MDIQEDYNLRENAYIIAMAIDAAKSLDSTELKQWFDKKYSMFENRVYLIEISGLNDEEVEYEDSIIDETISDEDFMTIAERQGTVYSLNSFVCGFNGSEIDLAQVNQETDMIRIITVPCFK